MNVTLRSRPWGTGLIKICGVQRTCEALAAVSSGAQFIGVVFASSSRRRITPEQARVIRDTISQRALLVGVFMDQSPQAIAQTARAAQIDVLQLHGCERDDDPQLAPWPIIKRVSPRDWSAAHSTGSVIPLLDPGAGDGKAHDWRSSPVDARDAFVAGGLTPDNVAEVIGLTGAFGVDVSTGVQGADGYKDALAMARFCAEARRAFGQPPSNWVTAT